MKTLLKEISEKALKLGDFEFSEEQTKNKWLGFESCSEEEIWLTEKRLEIELPEEYKKFVSVTNGFIAPIDVEPSFLPIGKIDFLENTELSEIISAYSISGIDDIGNQLKKSIVIGGILEEQHFLLIPPLNNSTNWKFWKFANWIPGEEEYKSLTQYFESVLEFLNEEIENEND